MPGLCGIVSGTADVEDSISSFRQVYGVAGVNLSEVSHVSTKCAIANFSRVPFDGAYAQPGTLVNSAAVLLLEGEIYNHAELSRLTAKNQETICDTLLALYLAKGLTFVEQLDGEFNIVIYETGSRKLTIVNDHIASYPLYYWNSSRAFVFGSEKKALLAQAREKREIDPVGLMQLIVHEHNLRDRTFIKGVRRLLPASILSLRDGHMSLSTYGGITVGQRACGTADMLLDEWRHRLELATAKRLLNKQRPLLSLSGGLDSRLVACSIPRTKRPLYARTAGTVGSRDVTYARRIATRLAFEHIVENTSDSIYSEVARKIVWRTEGELQFRHTLSIFEHQQAKAHGDDLVGGWLGDATSGAHLRPFMFLPLKRGDFLSRAFEWYAVCRGEELRSIFDSEFLAKHLPSVTEEFRDSYEPYGHLGNAQAYELWDVHNRQTRMIISAMPIDSYLFGKIRPFFDRSYLDFAMSIPLRFHVGQSLYKSLIHRMGPEIRDIPNANTESHIRAKPLANLGEHLLYSLLRVGHKSATQVQARFRRSLGRRQPTDLATKTRTDLGLRTIVEDFVRSSNFDASIFNREGILQLLDGHYRGRCDASVPLCWLVTLAIALQYFLYASVERCPNEAEPLGR